MPLNFSHGQNDKSILLAYFIPFVAWYTITNYDFISYDQMTIGESRRLGRTHLVLILLPTIYMAFVVYCQVVLKDYKTMSLALYVFVFGILHLGRTYYGLWQLQVFKQWLVVSIAKMESLGYRARLPSKDGINTEYRSMESPPLATQSVEDPEAAHARLNQYADLILMKDNLIDGIQNNRGISFDFHLLSKEQLEKIYGCSTMLGGAASCTYQCVISVLKIPALLYSLTKINTPDYQYINATPFCLPVDPEKLWIRWACTLASQFPDWVADMYNSNAFNGNGFMNRNDPRWRRRSSIAEMRNSSPFLRHFYLAHRSSVESPEIEPDSRTLPPHRNGQLEDDAADGTAGQRKSHNAPNCPRHRDIPLKQWMMRSDLLGCRSCKQQCLAMVLGSGRGLPYGLPHENARNWDGDDAPFGYEQFYSELDRAKDKLPLRVEEKIADLGVREVEWLSVFLGV